ncbi:MAG: hypothetical protein MUF42_11655 [Cytophagaceae bacterium]|nr:hypothetical protein [Cytophagaceae bacterium]
MSLFSSDYQDTLFVPFVSLFLQEGGNPWQLVWEQQQSLEFPYHPFLLYLLALFYAPVHFLFGDHHILINLFFKAPLLLADWMMFLLLCRLFSENKKEVLLYYFASPIIFYATYLHSQLDLIPTLFLFYSLHSMLQGKILKAGIIAGIAIGIKLHVCAAFPLLIWYIYRKNGWKSSFVFSLAALSIYLLALLPMYSEGFLKMVLENPKQQSIFHSAFLIANHQVYLPVLATFLLIARFSLYKKLNRDLLFSFLALLFSVFVMLVPPSPAWYVWMFPFLSIFFIRATMLDSRVKYLYYLVNASYLLFFIFFYRSEIIDLKFWGVPFQLKINNVNAANISFTILSASVLACLYAFYTFGVRSNAIYKNEEPLIIGIGGDSGSGKSTLLTDLHAILGSKLTQIEGDGDHKWERYNENWQQHTHLNPKANFLHKQSQDILNLKSGKTILRSDYDHHTGKFTKPKPITPGSFISICGLHPFYLPVMRKLIDLKVFLDTEDNLRLNWKLQRDKDTRGYSQEQVLKQWSMRKQDSEKFIAPQKQFADIIVSYFASNVQPMDVPEVSNIQLKFAITADIPMDGIVSRLYEWAIPITWDYAEDLKSQYLIFESPASSLQLSLLAKEFIQNLDEISSDLHWAEGYRGVVQWMVLYAISEKMKVGNHGNA